MSSILCSKTEGFLFTWEVKNINVSFYQERMVSPEFKSYNIHKSRWIMSLHSSSVRDVFTLYLECTDADFDLLEEFDVLLSVTVILPNGEECILKSAENFQFEDGSSPKKVASFQNFTLDKDTLVFNCHIQKPDIYLTPEGRQIYALSRSPIIRCSSHTEIGSEKRCCLWKVKDFANLLPDKQKKYKLFPTSLQSPELEICGTLSNKEKFQIEVHVLSDKRIFIVGRISVLTPQDELKWSKVKGYLVENGSTSKVVFKFPLIIVRKCVLSKLRDGDLNLLCEFSFSTGKMYSEITESNYLSSEHSHLLQRRMINISTVNEESNDGISKPEENSTINTEGQSSCNSESKGNPQTLKEDLKKFYLQKNHCDVTFKVESEKFPAHKSILCSRSSVFSAMFDSEMKETINKEVEIVDMEPDTLDRFLLFLYSESIEDLTWERSTKLLYAANKYHIDSLKVACTAFLMSNISVANVCEVLKLSDLYQDETLKSACQNVIFVHGSRVFASEEWESLTLENPMLSAKTFRNHFSRIEHI